MMNKKRVRLLQVGLSAVLGVGAGACGGGQAPDEPATPPASAGGDTAGGPTGARVEHERRRSSPTGRRGGPAGNGPRARRPGGYGVLRL
jgi:hypothetical protein